jgi:GT2 family glycosyltransferase
MIAYERILVVCDHLPTGRPDFPDARTSRLLGELRHLWPSAPMSIIAFDREPTDSSRWLEARGVEIVSPPLDLRAWLRARPFEFSFVLLAGVAACGVAPMLRESQPQAFVAVDVPLGAIEARDDFGSTLKVAEERLGERLVESFRRRRLEEALAPADAFLVESPADIGSVPAAKAFVFEGLFVETAADGPVGRNGAVLAASFTEEFGDPDEAGIQQLLDWYDTARQGRLDWLRFCLRRPPLGLRRRVSKVAPVATRALCQEAADARVLVTVRPFGAAPRWQRRVALETGTPWVLLGPKGLPGAAHVDDVAELHRAVAALSEDEDAWLAARATLLEAVPQSPLEARSGLVSLLGSAGFAPPPADVLSGPPAPLDGSEPFTCLLDDPGTVHRQVRTAGWRERRPMDPAMQRADVGYDFLLPQNGYGWWYDAHELSSDAAVAIREASAALAHQPLISIVMPVYNTAPDVLDDTIKSVRGQLYRHWELCIADDASTSPETLEVLERHARQDSRIRVHRMATNGGIAAASNTAAALASGEFLALLDHDDLLTPDALFEVATLLDRHPELDFIYSDEDKLDENGEITSPFFKPSWSPELHLAVNYVTHFAVYRKEIFHRVGGFRSDFDGSQDYDLSLRVTETTDRVGHIAKPIYTWRMVAGSAAVAHDAKPYALDAARRAIGEALTRRGVDGWVEHGLVPGTWRPRYPVVDRPTVSVLIPTRNGREMLERCVTGLLEHTAYRNIELVIIDNASDDPATLDYLSTLDATVVRYPYRFNYARQMNLAAEAATGDLLLLLNNDVEMVDRHWLEAMVEHGRRPDVGAVGARLVFPSGRPQHEGVFVSYGGGCAGNIDFGDYFGLGRMVRDCTAATAACLLTRPAVFAGIGGFDERLRVAFNDVDLCLRLRQRGYRIVYTPYAELVHAESASRGALHPAEDEAFFIRRWGSPGDFEDPFYNPNFDPMRPFRLMR